jgi:Flp pilus assembly protein TadD
LVSLNACERKEPSPSSSKDGVSQPLATAPGEAAGCEAIGADRDALYQRGVGLIDPYMKLTDRSAARGEGRERHLRAGIACLDRLLVLAPGNWAALWIRGKAFQSLGEHGSAADSFAQAYRIQDGNPDVGRELVVELLETRGFAQAVDISQQLARRHPQNAGLWANLALALLLAHDLPAARKAIDEALRLDSSDAITLALKQRIDEIAAGRRPQPMTLQDLEAS